MVAGADFQTRPKPVLMWFDKQQRKQSKEEGKTTTMEPAGKGGCLCSPTIHPGSFRCRYHKISTTTLEPQKPNMFSLLQNSSSSSLLATKPRIDVPPPNFHCGQGYQRQLSRFGRAAIAAAAATTTD